MPLGELVLNTASVLVKVNNKVLQNLGQDREFLQQQNGQYTAIANDFKTICAYETYKTSTALGHSVMVRTHCDFLALY